MKYGKIENKGVATILVAGITVGFLLVFAVLAIDFSRMYYVRGELQNAADSAALAGSDRLDGTNSTTQAAARDEAVKFASKNKAAGAPVGLASDGSNALTASNDITVGNWDPSTHTYVAGNMPINAVEVKARRTTGSPGGTVALLFGKLVPGLTDMGVARTATAARLPKATAPIAICIDTCAPGIIDPAGTLLYWAPYSTEVSPGTVGIAWTAFSPSQANDKPTIESFFCGAEKDACGLSVMTSNGYENDLARQFRCAFKNPLYNSIGKTCSDGACDSSSDNVTSWNVLVPIFSSPDGCPPGDQPDPDTVVSLGLMTITEVYASGGGGPNGCACAAYDAPKLNGPNAILVTHLQCVSCPATELKGKRSQLVK